MAKMSLAEFLKIRILKIGKPRSPKKMGVSSETKNGGYLTGKFRKVETFKDIIERRKNVERLLKKYA